MADKMMRIAGRNKNGQAEALKIDGNGNLKTPKPAYKRMDIDFGSIAPGETKRVIVRPRLLDNVSWDVKHIVLRVANNALGKVTFTWRMGSDSFYDEIIQLEGEGLLLTPSGMTNGEIVSPNEFSTTKGVQLQQYIQQIGYISNDALSYFRITNNKEIEISDVTCRIYVEEI